jgi:leucyl-tRNA---protein transferase
MESIFRYVAPPSKCGYLPNQTWRLEYDVAGAISPAEYLERMSQGWRRFGMTLFRPRCPACQACRSVRILVDRFRPNRSQRRVEKLNGSEIRLQIGTPAITAPKLELYDRYHAFQSEAKGWPEHAPWDPSSYVESFVNNPFPTLEFSYYLSDRLVGVGYVDDLPGALSAIYFIYDPELRARSLGTWNVLAILSFAAARKVPYLYLGYFVAGCRSMEYKIRFGPYQLLGPTGEWHDSR